MTRLVHKSINIHPEIWRKLRINAELSGVPLRDYLTFLIEKSEPVAESDAQDRAELARISLMNVEAGRGQGLSATTVS